MMLTFFFQAEDGIRDGHVTGVQTCALPILTVELEVPSATTAAGLADTVETLALTAPVPIVTLAELPVLPPAEAAWKVPAAALPVYFIPTVLRLATPFTKSPAWSSTFERSEE